MATTGGLPLTCGQRSKRISAEDRTGEKDMKTLSVHTKEKGLYIQNFFGKATAMKTQLFISESKEGEFKINLFQNRENILENK